MVSVHCATRKLTASSTLTSALTRHCRSLAGRFLTRLHGCLSLWPFESSSTRKGKLKVVRLRLVLHQLYPKEPHYKQLAHWVEHNHPAAPRQNCTKWPMVFGYAKDGQDVPSYVVVPGMKDGQPHIELASGNQDLVDPTAEGSPYAPLPGLFLFDAWRISPVLQHELTADSTVKKRGPPSSPLKAGPCREQVTKEGGQEPRGGKCNRPCQPRSNPQPFQVMQR